MTHQHPSLTVAELVEILNRLDQKLPVAALYDARCAGGDVTKVEVGPHPYDSRESVVLIIG